MRTLRWLLGPALPLACAPPADPVLDVASLPRDALDLTESPDERSA